jgi:hypothetical protein
LHVIEHQVSAIVQRILNQFQQVNGNAVLWADVRAPLPAGPICTARRQPAGAPPAFRVTAVTYGNADLA